MKDRLCVALLCNTYPPDLGGVAVHVQALARALVKRGSRVHIVTRQVAGASSEPELDGVEVHRLAATGARGVGSAKYIMKAAQLLSRVRPDVVHAHELQLTVPAALLVKRLYGPPAIVTVHSGGPLIGEVARVQRSRFGDTKMAAFRRHVDCFIAVGSGVDAELAAVGVGIKRRTVIPNGVDMNQFYPVAPAEKEQLRCKLGLPRGEIVIYTGRIVWEKRFQHLIDIWPVVRERFPMATLVLVGSGPEEENLRRRKGEGVIFTGPLENVAPYLQAADILGMPSIYEGFSLTTLEGLACGLPVVATRVGAVPEMVADGKSGYIVEIDDVPALQTRIIDLLSDPAKRSEFGMAGRAWVESRYSLDAMAANVEQVYRSALTTS